MKNIEKIRNMSAEELAEFLENSRCCCAYNGTDRCDNRSCEQRIAEWLEQEAEKPSIFEPRSGEYYYSIDYDGNVRPRSWFEDKFAESIINFGNACTDKSVMERKAHELKLWSLLWNFAEENNDEIDWDDAEEYKYYIYKDCMNKRWSIVSNLTCREYVMVIYFSSVKLAQRAIDEIVIPWERGEL